MTSNGFRKAKIFLLHIFDMLLTYLLTCIIALPCKAKKILASAKTSYPKGARAKSRSLSFAALLVLEVHGGQGSIPSWNPGTARWGGSLFKLSHVIAARRRLAKKGLLNFSNNFWAKISYHILLRKI